MKSFTFFVSMVILVALVALVAYASSMAHAQSAITASFCGDYKDFSKALKDAYSEHPIGKGLTGGGNFVTEFWTSKAGTYTVLKTNLMSGRTCIIDAGKGWMPQIDGEPS